MDAVENARNGRAGLSDQMPATLLNENLMNALFEVRKASIVTDSIITASTGCARMTPMFRFA